MSCPCFGRHCVTISSYALPVEPIPPLPWRSDVAALALTKDRSTGVRWQVVLDILSALSKKGPGPAADGSFGGSHIRADAPLGR